MSFRLSEEQIKIKNFCNRKDIFYTMLFGESYYFRIESFMHDDNYISTTENITFKRGEHVNAYNSMFNKIKDICTKLFKGEFQNCL